MSKYKIVAFDMVGVVLDEERIVSTTLFESLPEPKPVTREDLKARYDEGLRLGKISAEEFWQGVVDGESWVDFEKSFVEGLRLVDGVKEAIQLCAERSDVAVISDLPQRWAELALSDAGVAAKVAYGIFADQHGGQRKRDGSLFRVLEQQTGAAPGQTLVIDDTLANVRAAEQCGMDAVWFKRRESEDDGKPVTFIVDFATIESLV